MKEIEEAFRRIWDLHFNIYNADFGIANKLSDRIEAAEEAVFKTIQNLRKENFELYKALHGVKDPEDI